jgi:phenylalanyl-tRNA synthetase alpha chain
MDWQEYSSTALRSFADAGTLEELATAHTTALGRKSELKTALREVRDRETGMTLNAVRVRLEEAFEDRESELERAELDRRLSDDAFDVTVPGDEIAVGQLHPTTQVRRLVEDTFLGLGYEIRYDREIETVEYNFDKLAFEPTHPSRSPRATFFLDDDTVLRTETSPSQIHSMEEKPPPIYMVSIGRCYRRDAIDATHYPIFHQFEGLAVDRGLTLADLKGTLLHVMRALFGEDRRVRFRTHFFPFTEPSMEPDVSCGVCGGEGCRTCKYTGWLEMGGSGMVDPRVFQNVGLDPEEWSGFAFGVGLERVAQLRHGIAEIRPLWSPDLRALRQF